MSLIYFNIGDTVNSGIVCVNYASINTVWQQVPYDYNGVIDKGTKILVQVIVANKITMDVVWTAWKEQETLKSKRVVLIEKYLKIFDTTTKNKQI